MTQLQKIASAASNDSCKSVVRLKNGSTSEFGIYCERLHNVEPLFPKRIPCYGLHKCTGQTVVTIYGRDK
jgi:hypothetical protein